MPVTLVVTNNIASNSEYFNNLSTNITINNASFQCRYCNKQLNQKGDANNRINHSFKCRFQTNILYFCLNIGQGYLSKNDSLRRKEKANFFCVGIIFSTNCQFFCCSAHKLEQQWLIKWNGLLPAALSMLLHFYQPRRKWK